MTEAQLVEEIRQRVIGMVTEARSRFEQLAERAAEIRGWAEGPEPWRTTHKQTALGEVTQEARDVTTQAIREARAGVSGGWVVGREGIGTRVQAWHRDLSSQGLAARDSMLDYVAAAELVFEVDVEELVTGEAPVAARASERDTAAAAAAAELAAYEESHPAPEAIVPARSRWSGGE